MMRVWNELWIRPVYPGDETEIERLLGSEFSERAEAAVRAHREPRSDLAIWVAQRPSGRLAAAATGRLAKSASSLMGDGGPERSALAAFEVDGLSFDSDVEAQAAQAVLTGLLSAVARAGGSEWSARLRGDAEAAALSLGALDASWPRLADVAQEDAARLKREFCPPLEPPADAWLLDLRNGPDRRNQVGDWSIGRYNEKRRGMYLSPLFEGARDVHLGLDIGGPVGHPIRAFADGEVVHAGYNSADGDYGHVIVTRHRAGGLDLFALFGHLQAGSTEGAFPGKLFSRGDVVAWIGDVHENGGWEHPHLHLQLSWRRPETHDMPGTTTDEGLAQALRLYPDPRLVAGYLY